VNVKKYSKSSAFYFEAKNDFFSENDVHLNRAKEINNAYSTQPKRVNCKLCCAELALKFDFCSHGVDYVFCTACGHLNGIYEDTEDFISNIYIDDDGVTYANNYIDKSFEKRMRDIYLPKAEFLVDNMPGNQFSVLDVGCGAGYFVAACQTYEIDAEGLDVSQSMIDFGNNQILNLNGSRNNLKVASESDFFQAVVETRADIISVIGVIEHLRQPHRLFEAFQKSHAQYLYFSVPMFSLSSALEHALPQIYPRQLSGAHTHLFTEESIRKMYEIMQVEPVAEWRFGTDIQDLFRSLLVMFEKTGASNKLLEMIQSKSSNLTDTLQKVLDEEHFCSEIHGLVKKVTSRA